jgi:hypothetical protein
MRCSKRLVFAFVVALGACTGSAVAQSVTLTVTKTEDFKQASTATPVQVTNPFTFSASATASFTITSATVTPLGGSTITLAGSGTTFRFDSNPFATVAALNAAFPNVAYKFNLQNASGAAISGDVTMPNTDNYPAPPTLTNSGWVGSGALEFDPNAPFTFSWSAASQTPSRITLIIRDATGAIIFNPSIANTATSVILPAGTLRPGAIYTAQLAFANTTITQTAVGGSTIVSVASYTSETTFTINPVISPPNIATPTGLTLIQGQAIAYQLAATSIADATLDTSSLPKGLSWDPTTGIIFGTPAASGTFQPSYTIQNAAGQNGGILTLTAAAPSPGPMFANATSATGRVGVPFSFQLTTTGASAAAKFSATNLPAGLTITQSGLISGTVNTVGSTAVNVTLSDGGATRTSNLQLTFVADVVVPVITSPKIVTLYPGQKFSYQITAAYGASRVDEPAFKVYGTLPSGLNFDAKTGVISGTFTGQLERNGDPPDYKFLNDSPLVQLSGTNTHGTGTSPLIFLAAPTGTVNLSTRMFVGTNDEVLIGGFIITGTASEKVLLRGIGPSLPVTGALQDPVLELHDATTTIATNDNWQDDATQAQVIKDAGVPPTDNRESALAATFQPANFTAIVRGNNSTTGIGLVELFDLGTVTQDTSQHAKLAQISTRGTVRTGDNVMIGGFIVQGVATKVLLRGIGPELTAKGVSGALQDTVLELHGGDGTLLAGNDDWKSAQQQEIVNTGVPPTDDRESALIATLNPGNYTAVLRGKNDTSGVALVEVYNLQ